MTRYEYRSALAGDIVAFLEFKGDVGISSNARDWILMRFDRWCVEHGATALDRETVEGFVLEWSGCPSHNDTSWMPHIRQLGKFMRGSGAEDAYVLPDGLRPSRPRPTPYLLDADEVERFFGAAAALRMRVHTPWEWQATCFFGLMHSLGLRPGECRRLGVGDVDWDGGHVDIAASKAGRSRRLPVTGEVLEMMRSCDARAGRELGPRRQAFFCTMHGAPVSVRRANAVFSRIWADAGLPSEKGGRRPTPYAFRHRFAYANLERWAAEGRDVDAMLPYLSRFMGHATFSSTYYYVHVSPDFMSGYADAVAELDGVLPEVGFDA